MLDIFDPNILNKYNNNAPRYTSYPTALSFSPSIQEKAYFKAIDENNTGEQVQALSLYLHIPFCHSLCYYCGCNKIVTRHKHKAEQYVEYLLKEIIQRAEHFSRYRVGQIHFGGGTPSFLNAEQLQKIITTIKSVFAHDTLIDMSIEIDPRRINPSYVERLAAIGFSRLSIGVQDINQVVQEKINRIQSTSFIEHLVKQAKTNKFDSVNLDLIYGLPSQTLQIFERTLDKIIDIDPHRISLFSYAHLPSQFAAQRKIKEAWLPSANEKLALFELAVKKLTNAGYLFIGMDHFAKPQDTLSLALAKGELHRNFQGYTAKAYPALLGLGLSSISSINSVYVQNPKDLKQYYNKIDNNESLISKGLALTKDDLIRRDVIHSLMCNFTLNKSIINAKYNIDFNDYFANEVDALMPFIKDNLLELNEDTIHIHERARLVIRHICMTFDAHQSLAIDQNSFSNVI